jgi:mono/diheme cytochrome c family protein
MKRTFTVIASAVLIWGCAHKSTPATSSTGISSNNGAVVNAPPATSGKTETVVTNTTPVAPAGTVPNTPAGTRTPAEGSTIKTPEMLGQSTYNTKCGKCHGLKVTTDYTPDRWISIMQVMAGKAHLDDTEKENVLAYVKANAKK